MSFKKWSIRILVIAIVVALLCAGTAWAWLQKGRADIAGEIPDASLMVTSSNFKNGEPIPPKFTCDGANVSPDIQWSVPPGSTKSIVIVMDDSDAPLPFTHWLAYNISGDIRDLPEGASTPSIRLDRAAEGTNSFGNIGYGGPCPPSGTHHYSFRVYALDVVLSLPSGQNKEQLAKSVKGHVLAEGMIIGLFSH
jgi:Raf kinase inhibitor-like YbhB/YbcL family protein